ncbi:MAG: hypothetical protein HRT58_16425 [Crocinitomicaceae bacterium]|nr:hypothetical protein [Flavobacteriales bacterium]NQZ37252.1 hypothetical protein [Crocinitomicaceae bacterium]
MTDSTDTSEPKKKGTGGYIAVIILLLIALGVMFFFLSSEKSKVSDCAEVNMQLEEDNKGMNEMLEGYVGNISNDLKTDFQNMLKTYDALLTKDESKADSINAQKARIEELLSQVEQGKMNAYQLQQMRRENETLRKIMKGYVVQIDSLNTLNLRLESDLDSTSTQLNLTKEERDQIREVAAQQGVTIDKAKRLQAYGFSSGALRAKLNSTTTPTTKARNTIQFVSSFTISENSVALKENKAVYMQITDPNGKVFQRRSSNIAKTENGDISYSDKKVINYVGSRVDVAIYYDLNGQDISKGNYKVRIYCQGQLIGSDSFSLK